MRVRPSAEETSTQFELAANGTYLANVYAVKPGKGPQGDFLKWELELVGVETNSEGKPAGRIGHVYEVTTLKEGGRWRLSQLAGAAGLDPADFDTDEILGKQVMVSVEIVKDPGYPAKMEVKRFLKP